MYSCAAASHVGKIRHQNQDSFLSRQDIGLWIVADGMGGHDNGKQASKMACNIISQCVENGDDIHTAIKIAHHSIQAASKNYVSEKGMGTTIVVLACQQEQVCVSWVGDSRAYLFSNNQLRLLTKDHSLVQLLVDRKIISQEEAIKHPKRKLLTQSVGFCHQRELKIDSLRFNRPLKAEILLCSDGLTNELSDKHIITILQQKLDQQTRVQQLINDANGFGGKDNITAMLIAC